MTARPLKRPPHVRVTSRRIILNAHSAHVCGLEYATACRLLSAFRQANVTTLTLDPSGGYMNAGAFEEARILFQGLAALLVSEEKLRGLFWGRTDDLWQMAEAVGNCGCEIIVIKRGSARPMAVRTRIQKRVGNTGISGAAVRPDRRG